VPFLFYRLLPRFLRVVFRLRAENGRSGSHERRSSARSLGGGPVPACRLSQNLPHFALPATLGRCAPANATSAWTACASLAFSMRVRRVQSCHRASHAATSMSPLAQVLTPGWRHRAEDCDGHPVVVRLPGSHRSLRNGRHLAEESSGQSCPPTRKAPRGGLAKRTFHSGADSGFNSLLSLTALCFRADPLCFRSDLSRVAAFRAGTPDALRVRRPFAFATGKKPTHGRASWPQDGGT